MLVQYRMLATDVDGTLLDSAHQLRPRVAAAIVAAQASGMVVVLATGKLFSSITPLLHALGLQGPQIVLNGAATQVSPAGAAQRFVPLTDADRRAIVTAVRAADPDVLVSQFGLDGLLMDREHPRLGIFAEYGEGPVRFVDDLLAPGLPLAGKILLCGAPEQLVAVRDAVTPVLANRVAITTTTPDFLEFFGHAAGKGQALVALCESLAIPREAVIAIGDGENDLPLLREAGLAIAMANGSIATRAAAHRIAPSNDEDGLAVVLEELLALPRV